MEGWRVIWAQSGEFAGICELLLMTDTFKLM
jgi:hypothetical protein